MSLPEGAATLVDAAARRYARCGRFCRGFVRGKLRWDPVYLAVLRLGWIESGGTVLDLGCGRGILLALLAASRDEAVRRAWPAGWAPAPEAVDLRGIEGSSRTADEARLALGADAAVETSDLRAARIPACRTALLLDVLHYLDDPSQEDLLDRVVAALEPGGVVLVREVDAVPAPASAWTRAAERAAAACRGCWRPRFAFRNAAAWRDLLEARGLTVESRAADQDTPFSNTLFRARRSRSGTILRSRHGGGGAVGGLSPER